MFDAVALADEGGSSFRYLSRDSEVLQFLTTEKPGGKTWARMTFSNWQAVTVPEYFFQPPKGAKRVEE